MTSTTDRLNAALAGRYRIERELGQGGMATVYLADDLKHDRKVALKVLKPELAAVLGAERFVVEIKTTAALQHPHILALFDSGTADGFLFYVMPYIQGETLRDKLNRETQLGVDDAVRIAREVLDALHYAHEHGIVHRDVKPENILLHGGHAMVADFGIALAVSAAAGGRMTETGLSLGTPHYMSPEQATAEKEITARSDVYSLGSVLYEMLAGQPPHVGGSAQQIIMKIITEQAQTVMTLRKSVPANVAAAVAKSLEKLPADRFENAKAFASALSNPAFTSSTAAPPSSAAGASWVRVIPWTIAAAAVVWALTRSNNADDVEHAQHWNMALPDSASVAFENRTSLGVSTPSLAISRDGKWIAYIAKPLRGAVTHIVVRQVGGTEVRSLPGTEGANSPFFSPDGAWVGFFTASTMKKVELSGARAPVTITEVTFPYGASWAPNGRIVFSNREGVELQWVSEEGGTPVRIPGVDGAFNPQVLADGDHVIFEGDDALGVTSMSTGGTRFVVRDGPATANVLSDSVLFGRVPRVTQSGHLMYFRPGSNAWMVVRFDPRTLRVSGVPVPAVSGVRVESTGCQCDVSEDGTLVFAEGDYAELAQFVWASPSGRLDTLSLPASTYGTFVLSPDGRQLAVTEVSPAGHRRLEVYGVDGQALSRSGASFSKPTRGVLWPMWTPRGEQLFVSRGMRGRGLREVVRLDPANGRVATVIAERAPSASTVQGDSIDGAILQAIAPDGVTGVYARPNSGMFAWPLAANGSATVSLGQRPGNQIFPAFSHDGRWLAYTSEEAGRWEVFVEPFPTDGTRRQVSIAGGEEPVWAGDNRLFYRFGPRWYRVAVGNERTTKPLAPTMFLEGDFINVPGWSYAVARDGTRLLVLKSGPEWRATTLNIVTNWFAELKRLAP